MSPTITIHLVYEPHSVQEAPVPIVRLENAALTVMVAKLALEEAEQHAANVYGIDDYWTEFAVEEVERLRRILALLVPELDLGRPALAVQ